MFWVVGLLFRPIENGFHFTNCILVLLFQLKIEICLLSQIFSFFISLGQHLLATGIVLYIMTLLVPGDIIQFQHKNPYICKMLKFHIINC